MFSWAMREGLALSNPVANTNKREEKTRNRVLSEAELRAIWQTLDDMDNYAVIIKLLILTGQRAGEIAGLRWSEIDFHRNLICLPASRTKNNRPHNIPIAPGVRALLQPRECTSGHDPIFTTRGERFRDWSRHKHLLNARITEATGQDLQHWTPHDLRRTSATGMAEIGIQPHIIEAVLNHVSGHKSGIAGIYNRASYEGEKAAALVRWDEYIRSVVEGSAVPQLQGR
jgi:integrase